MRNSWVSLTPLDGGLAQASHKGFATDAVNVLDSAVKNHKSQ